VIVYLEFDSDDKVSGSDLEAEIEVILSVQVMVTEIVKYTTFEVTVPGESNAENLVNIVTNICRTGP
jgi:hypothetical protein